MYDPTICFLLGGRLWEGVGRVWGHIFLPWRFKMAPQEAKRLAFSRSSHTKPVFVSHWIFINGPLPFLLVLIWARNALVGEKKPLLQRAGQKKNPRAILGNERIHARAENLLLRGRTCGKIVFDNLTADFQFKNSPGCSYTTYGWINQRSYIFRGIQW